MTIVKLHGGRYDGLEGEVKDACIEAGLVIISNCAKHGENSHCGCDDEMWHGYHAEPSDCRQTFEIVEPSPDVGADASLPAEAPPTRDGPSDVPPPGAPPATHGSPGETS